jgi:hypothetical protein
VRSDHPFTKRSGDMVYTSVLDNVRSDHPFTKRSGDMVYTSVLD